ncbi:MAG: hypothetical protein H6641_15725 [Caldilineaceae bacterium]|nr:hypothetical protein [Caldilineaceae bacterium]
MRNRVIVHLLPEERAALLEMSSADVRPPEAQIRYLLVSEAARRGLLSQKNNTGACEFADRSASVITATN